jgi:cbb3-type cytochrome oxidase subunit 3
MLKFIKQHMSTIGGVEIYPVIGFLLFFTFFLVVLWWVLTTDRRRIRYMENMPLANDHAINDPSRNP